MGRKTLGNAHLRLRQRSGESGETKTIALIGLLAALLTLLAAFISAGALNWLPGPWGSENDVPPPQSGNAAPSPQLVIQPVAQLPGAGDGGALGEELLDAAAGSGVSVAVGWTEHEETGRDPAVWLLRDGSWNNISGNSDAFANRPGDQELKSVAPHGDGFVAVGEDDGRAAVYTSADGLRWSQDPLEDDDPQADKPELLRGVATNGKAVVAVGTRGPRAQQHAAIWVAPDGRTWRRATLTEAAGTSSADSGGQVLYDVVHSGLGFVAIGRSASARGHGLHEPLIRVSQDGQRWRRIPTSAIVDPDCDPSGCRTDQVIFGIAATETRLIAVGSAAPTANVDDCRRSGAVWVSSEGTSWKRVPLPLLMRSGNTSMYGVAVSEGQVIAVGGRQCDRPAATVWTSLDEGERWSAFPSGGIAQGANASMAAVSLEGGEGVIVGSDAPSTKALAWTVRVE
jgi:hypothetical protein